MLSVAPNHEYFALCWTDLRSQISNKESDRSSFVIHTERERETSFLKKSEISPTCYVTAARFRVKISRSDFIIPLGPPLTLSPKEMMR